MADAATETPAAYLLATEFHDTIVELVEPLGSAHDHLSTLLISAAERIMGNVGAAEAPWAADRRQRHYQIAFAAVCGCASACDLVFRLRLGPRVPATRARRLLASLGAMIRPIADEGMEPRSEIEEAILADAFSLLENDREPWRTGEMDEDW